MVRVSQPVLSMLPSGARAIGPSAGLLEGPDGGVVFVFGLATFSYAAGDEVGRRLTAVQLVAMRISSAREVAGAFGVSTVTLWRWSQTFAHGGVLALGRDRSGPKGPTKLTEVVTARIVALDGQGRTLAQIAAGTAVSTATVRVALGRVAPRAPSVQVSGEPNVADDWQIDGDGEQDTEASVGAELVVLAAPVPRVAERTAARFGELAEAPVVFTEGAHLRRVDAGFNLLTYYKGTWTRSEPTAFATVDFTTPDGTTATYELAERLIDLAVPARPATPAQAGRPASTLTLRLIVRRSPSGHQTPILTNRTDLSAPEIAYRMATRWRQENYFKYAREHFALDALDSYADQPDDLDRMVPNPAKAHAHDLVVGAGFRGVGDHPVKVVGLVGVAVQGVQGEVLTGAGEVVLLPPPVRHPVGDQRCGQVGAVGQDRGLMPGGAGPHDQPQRQRARRSCAGGRGGGSGRDRQVDQTFGELVADGRPVGGGEVVERERGRSGPGPGALVVGEQVEPGCDDLGEHRRGVPAPVEYHGAGPVGADDGAQVGQQTGQLGGQRRRRGCGDDHDGVTVGVGDPGLLGRGAGDPHPGDVGLGQLAGAGIHAHVSVEVEEPGRVRAGGGVVGAQGGLQLCAGAGRGELSQLAAQGLDLRGPVQPQDPAQVGGGDPGRALRAGLTQQRQEHPRHQGGAQPVEPVAHRPERLGGHVQEPGHLQRCLLYTSPSPRD